MLPELVGHSHVVGLESIIQALNALGDSKQLYSAVCALITLLLTLPTTTATVERSFSCVRRVKTYLRSTMSTKRLNSHCALHTHQTETESLDVDIIMNEFVGANDRRRRTFGTAKIVAGRKQ